MALSEKHASNQSKEVCSFKDQRPWTKNLILFVNFPQHAHLLDATATSQYAKKTKTGSAGYSVEQDNIAMASTAIIATTLLDVKSVQQTEIASNAFLGIHLTKEITSAIHVRGLHMEKMDFHA